MNQLELKAALIQLTEELRKLPNRDDTTGMSQMDGGGVGYLEVVDLIYKIFDKVMKK